MQITAAFESGGFSLEQAMLELTVDKRQSLREFTDNAYAQASFYFNALLKNRDIKVNGKRVDKDIPVFAGDVVSYYTIKPYVPAHTGDWVACDDAIVLNGIKYELAICWSSVFIQTVNP